MCRGQNTEGEVVNYNFYIKVEKKAKTKHPKCIIQLYIRDKRGTIYYNTGEKIEEKYWDKKKQIVKKSYTGSTELNAFLRSFKEDIENKIRTIQTEKPSISLTELKKLLKTPVKEAERVKFMNLFQKFIEGRRTTLSHATYKKYKTLFNHLKEFQKKSKIKLDVETIDVDVLDQLQNYFLKKGHNNNTTFKHIQNLRTFLNWALERDLTDNIKYQKFNPIKRSNPESIALTKEELKLLVDCTDLTQKLERTKDLFLFMVYTGQRYSDAVQFNKDDVKNDVWYFRQKKTTKVMKIPLSRPAILILEKYDYNLPVMSNQKMNSNLKYLGEKAGIDEIVAQVKYNGSKQTIERYPKYQLLTSHVARRTFVSLAAYGGISQQVIKSFTGHSTDRMVSQYFIENPVQAIDSINNVFEN